MALEQPVDGRAEERWAAWQARGAENDRKTKRRFFIAAVIVMMSAAILGIGRWW